MNRKALLKEWERDQRRGGFYLLLFIQTLLPLLLLSLRRVVGGDSSLTAFLVVYRRLLLITLPLTQLWGWNRRGGNRGITALLELPLSLRGLTLLMGRFHLGSLLYFLSPAGLVMLFGFLLNFEPLVLIFSLAALLLEGAWILSLSLCLSLLLEGRVPALLTAYLALLVYQLLLPLSNWGLESIYQGYFKGGAFLLHLLLISLFVLLWAFTLRKRRRG